MRGFIIGCLLTFAVLSLGSAGTVQLFTRSAQVVSEGAGKVAEMVREVAR